MNLDQVHESHDMEYNEFSSDNHDDRRCKVCEYSTCVLCRGTNGMDDDELQIPCLGFPWTKAIFDGDGKVVGRKSGTGWPRKSPGPLGP